MKNFALLRSLVLVFLFAAGFQMASNAQITITNLSNCPILLKTGLLDNCTLCDDSGLQFLPANGGMYMQAFNPQTCPDDIWKGVKWVNANFNPNTVGYSTNPVFNFGCPVLNQPGSCQGNGVNAFWTSGGPGAVSVFIF